MQKRILLILVIFICHSSIARTLSVGWEPWPPYQYKDKRGQLTGLDIEIFQAIVKKADFTVKYTKLPWKRHLNYIKSGYIDIAFGASYSNKRDKYAYFSNCYRFEKVRLFIRKNNKFHLNKIDDLSHSEYLIGTQRGYYYGDHFTKLMQSDEFEKHVNTVLDIKQNLSMLLKKRIDGLIADPLTMKALIKKNNLTKKLEQYPLDIYQTKIYVMLSRKSLNKKTLKKINKAIQTIKQDGSLATILAKWGAKL